MPTRMQCMTVYWDSRSKQIGMFFSGAVDGSIPSRERIKEYADRHCPPEFRMVEGVDSLQINYSFGIEKIGRS